jgi:hypothetical protein
MMQLASEYGISGNGLAKICRKLAVPYPGRGYWARKAAGQKVSRSRNMWTTSAAGLVANARAPKTAGTNLKFKLIRAAPRSRPAPSGVRLYSRRQQARDYAAGSFFPRRRAAASFSKSRFSKIDQSMARVISALARRRQAAAPNARKP